MWRVDSLEKILMLGGIGGRRRRGQWRMRWLDGITKFMDMRLGELRELVMDREAWRAAIRGVPKSWTRLSDWTELKSQMGFPASLVVKNLLASASDTYLISGSERSPEEWHGDLLWYSCLGKSHGQKNLVGCSPWGRKESDMTSRLNNNNRRAKYKSLTLRKTKIIEEKKRKKKISTNFMYNFHCGFLYAE